jgi:hypothetical protein
MKHKSNFALERRPVQQVYLRRTLPADISQLRGILYRVSVRPSASARRCRRTGVGSKVKVASVWVDATEASNVREASRLLVVALVG